VNALLAEMAAEARAAVARGAFGAPVEERRLAYMRYVGQGHEITVALPVRKLTPADAAVLRDTFEKEYAALFARPIPGAAIEVLSWSVLVSTEARLPEPAAPVKNGGTVTAQGRRTFFDGRAGGPVDVPLYRRERLASGAVLDGPAVIAEDETSTFVSSGFTAHIDAAGCIVMERKSA
jgi:N-methylhydantoinase A